MTIIKLGEALEINSSDIVPVESVLTDSEVIERFSKYASTLKRIAPKAEDFLYFSAIMMHAAEASLFNSDGSPKLDSKGSAVKAKWEKKGESWKWVSSDPSIKPYKNSNGDIFPEEELVKAYSKWVGKPLCIDHKSSSVDAIRGLIVDTYYDRKLKRVIALCALDKVNYPDLARKVASGYATCVSMGTAVGKAVCSDCGQVAKTAEDFCHHMRSKSCYGEINIDLQPIELSIVVNGADPQAKIKHIIASANNINRYIDSKQNQLLKLSSQDLINDSKEIISKLNELKSDLSLLMNDNKSGSLSQVDMEKRLEDLSSKYSGITKDLENFEKESVESDKQNLDDHANDSQPSDDKNSFASNEVVGLILENIEKLSNKIDLIKEATFNKNFDNTISETNMTNKKEAYFQGGGGVNEPSPGQPKYEKEKTNEDLRNNEDRHMANVPDTGAVDGLYPGDLERKELLARAEVEQRSVRRAAALENAKKNVLNQKEAYYQGAGKESDPTPGKTKYPADPMNEKLRDQDKHMVGQKPFPNVGDVEGLLGGKEEVAQKKLLQRAALKVRFVKAANTDGSDNRAESSWQVFSDDKLVMTASVKELSGGKVDVFYDTIANRDFGQKMFSTIKSLGFDKAKEIYKKAQDVPAAPPADLAPPALPMEESPLPDMSKDGDPKDNAVDLAEQVRDASSDLVEAVKALTGEQAEVNQIGEMPKSASSETLYLLNMKKELAAALIEGMKKSASELKDHEAELKLLASIIEKEASSNSNKSYINSILEDAAKDAKVALADSYKLMGAFVKYARGTEALVKRADAESKLSKNASELEGNVMSVDDTNDADLDSLLSDLEDETLLNNEIENLESLSVDDSAVIMGEQDSSMANDGTVVQLPPGVAVPTGAKAVTASFDLTTREGRSAYRAKLAADVDSDMVDEAHPKGGVTTELDVKPSGDLAKVETIVEVHNKMLDVAKAPAKVRKEAEEIQQLVSEGKLSADDVDALVAHGADADAVKYWKQFYGQAGKEGSQFATEMVKEHAKAKTDEDASTFKVKLARAYSLANEMVRRGIVADEDGAVTAQVDEIMKWNDEGFDYMKKLISKQASMKKSASSMPQVGVIGSGDSVVSSGEGNLYEDLVRAFSGSTKKYQ